MASGDRRAHQAVVRRSSSARERIAVIGAGYVGLPTAAALAHFGHDVTCAERDPRRLSTLLAGEVPIMEDGLADLVREGVGAGRLRFVARAAEAVLGCAFVFLCVPTPQAEDGSADLRCVEEVAEDIAEHLSDGAIVVNKSTVPIGTASLVERVTGRYDITVVSNPEFLREGSAVQDSLHPERIVVGADDRYAAARVGELFASTRAPVVVTDTTSAETIKYASNAFLATKLSFVNAMAGLCEAIGADVSDVIVGIGYDKRIGFDHLRPGPGWGGSCLPKDTRALVRIAETSGYDFALLRGAIASNDDQLVRMLGKVVDALGGPPAGAVVAVWGLTFKAGTDDRRSSPALALAGMLSDAGAVVRAYDPTVMPPPAGPPDEDLSGITLHADAYEVCRGASVVLLATEWEEFRRLDFAKVRDLMERPAIVDARNLLDPAVIRRHGFRYTGVGPVSRALVAGGAGFLGSHLCDALLARGDEVVCVDDLSTGDLSNIAHLRKAAGFSFLRADVSREVPAAGRFDVVCHLASPASPPAYMARPFETLAAGSEGTRRLLEVADRHGARFLLASTSEIYGDPQVHPQAESYRGNVEATGPRSVYDEAKRFAEAMTMASMRARGTDVCIVRIFNTYGPRLSPGDGRVVSNFVVQALTGEPITVYGDGRQTRSLCYVDDEVAGLMALIDAGVTGPLNLGNPDERSISELAHLVLEATGSASPIVHRPAPLDDPVRRCPDIALARRLLGWHPVIGLSEGLARTVSWFADRLEGSASRRARQGS
jgi:UDPglucose 6-dehydrogenase